MQTKAAPGKGGAVSPRVANSIKGLRGGGAPLAKSTKAFFEPRFGQDFSKVRLHTDAKAADMADSIRAKAFTLGNDIAFAKGAFNPESKSGKQLLAHELTHTVQQGGLGGEKVRRQPLGLSGATNYAFDTYKLTESHLSDPSVIAKFNELSQRGIIAYRARYLTERAD
ncbi:MAG: DUF4157 domain-containing protein, partial [Sphingomonadales bacterium]